MFCWSSWTMIRSLDHRARWLCWARVAYAMLTWLKPSRYFRSFSFTGITVSYNKLHSWFFWCCMLSCINVLRVFEDYAVEIQTKLNLLCDSGSNSLCTLMLLVPEACWSSKVVTATREPILQTVTTVILLSTNLDQFFCYNPKRGAFCL